MADIQALVTDNLDIWTAAIKTQSTSGRGSRKKLELTGIKKLRELILELAVRGKLVHHDVNDGNGCNLLKRIDSYLCHKIGKQELPKLKRDKSIIDPASYHYLLPSNWIWCELQDITLFTNGKAHEQYVTDISDYILINSKFVSNNGRIIKYVSERLTPLSKGDIAIVMSDVPRGRALAKCFLVEEDDKYTLNQRIGGFVTSPEMNNNYLMIALNRNKYLMQYDDGQKQTNLKKIQILSCPIPLPPLEEQHRIVTKVNELMALCDQLEQQTEASITAHQTLVNTLLDALVNPEQDATAFADSWRLIEQNFDLLFTTEQSIDKLKQTILQLAVMGKLFPQDSNDEPASVLLEKIAAEKEQLIKEKKIKKQKVLPEITDDEKLFNLPKGWEWCRLDDVSLHSEAGWSPRCLPTPRESNKWGVLKVSAVTWGKFKPEENKELPDNLEPRKMYEVKSGDFLISRANTAELVARAVVVPNGVPRHLMMSDKIIRFVFSNFMDTSFINLFNSCKFSRNYYSQVAGGTSSSMKNVSREHIRSLRVAIPPINEQHQIVKKVDDLFNFCDNLKSQLINRKRTQQLLSNAFVGKILM